MKVSIALVVVLDLVISVLAADKCYERSCSVSPKESKCVESETKCMQSGSICVKADMSVENYPSFSVKGCALSESTKKQVCDLVIEGSNFPTKPKCSAYLCSEDLCNSASMYTISTFAVIAVAGLIVKLNL